MPARVAGPPRRTPARAPRPIPGVRAPQRPAGVSVLATLAWLAAALAFAAGASAWALGVSLADEDGNVLAGLGGLVVLLAAAYALVGWGLWTRRRWAWYGTLAVEGIAVFLALAALLAGDLVAPLVSLLVAGVVVVVLLRREVQAWFGVRFTRRGRGEPVG